MNEPFKVLSGDVANLEYAVTRRGLKLTSGGRFLHITGHNDKADAVLLLIEAWRKIGKLETIGVGDAPNDCGFLNLVDYPVLLGPQSEELQNRIPRARIAPAGPGGWREAILRILADH